MLWTGGGSQKPSQMHLSRASVHDHMQQKDQHLLNWACLPPGTLLSLLIGWINQSFLCGLSHFSTDWQLLGCCQQHNCGTAASALCAAEPLGLWSLLPPWMWCVAPLAKLWSHPTLSQRFIVAKSLFSISQSLVKRNKFPFPTAE